MTTPFAPTSRDVLRAAIQRHHEAAARWRIIEQERREAAQFALALVQDARDELEAELAGLDDAYEALNAVKRSERTPRRMA